MLGQDVKWCIRDTAQAKQNVGDHLEDHKNVKVDVRLLQKLMKSNEWTEVLGSYHSESVSGASSVGRDTVEAKADQEGTTTTAAAVSFYKYSKINF